MSDIEQFKKERQERLDGVAPDSPMVRSGREFFVESIAAKYSYNFDWLGLPVIQYPQDIVAIQEIVWRVQPDLIIETGVARGGSVVFYASLLELLGGNGKVVGIDIDIRPHNLEAIRAHRLAHRIELIQGSSVEDGVVERVRALAAGCRRILVALDSNHTHDHVLAELRAYSGFVGAGSYLIVLDTCVEQLPAEFSRDRPWGPGNSPMTAVDQFLGENDRFAVDETMDRKLIVSVSPRGYLRCVKD